MTNQADKTLPKVLVLTPVKDAQRFLSGYVDLIERLDWPKSRLSIGILESDSADDTPHLIDGMGGRLSARAQRVTLVKKDFGFHIPLELPRWDPGFQLARRAVLARCRNHLLFRALRDEDWVLWLDVDVIDYPADTIHRLLAYGCDILHPHCVREPNGPTFDRNAWSGGGRAASGGHAR